MSRPKHNRKTRKKIFHSTTNATNNPFERIDVFDNIIDFRDYDKKVKKGWGIDDRGNAVWIDLIN